MNFLIADDSRLMRMRVKNAIESMLNNDVTIWLAEDGNQAFKIIQERDVDVLITDQEMPGMNGDVLIKRVGNQISFGSYIFSDRLTDIEASACGVLGVLPKNNMGMLSEAIRTSFAIVENKKVYETDIM